MTTHNSTQNPLVITLDLEGVMVPEIWMAVARETGIETLKRTTRDEPDYNVLMQGRLDILNQENISLSTIQSIIRSLGPLDGAKDFLDELRSKAQVIILSDTFYDFSDPFMEALGRPTLFCHSLQVENDRIVGYKLRQADQKRKSVQALHSLNFRVHAAGDSYNDTSMLLEADRGILFRAPQTVVNEFPTLDSVNFEYSELIEKLLAE